MTTCDDRSSALSVSEAVRHLFAILLLASTAAAVELPLLPDQPVAPVAYVPSAGNDSPRAATNGDTVFVVWRVLGSGLVEGACLRHDGAVLQVPSIVIGQGVNPNSIVPSVLWIGGHYLVLWTDSSGKTFARRFAGDGSSMDVGSRPANIITPGYVVGDGTHAMVIGGDNGGVIVQRIDADGQPIASAVHVSPGSSAEAAAASNKGIVILEGANASEQILWLGWDGAILKVTPLAEMWFYGSLAEGSGRFLLTDGYGHALLLDSDGTAIGQRQTLETGTLTRAAWNGSSWCVVGSRLGNFGYLATNVTRISDGQVGGSVNYPAFSGMGVSDLTWNGTTFVAVGDASSGVMASLFPTIEATARSPLTVPVSFAAPEEAGAVIASTADRSLAVWRVRVDATTFALRGAFIVDGMPSEPFELAEHTEEEVPAVATDGIGFFVAWRDGLAIRARTVSSRQLLGPVQTIQTWAPSGAVGATWSGRAWVIAYVDTLVHVAALARSGVLTAGPSVVTNPTPVSPISSSVSLACDDSDCLLVTRLVESVPRIGTPVSNTGTFAARVSRDGAVADPLVRIPMEPMSGWPLAMRVNGASIIITNTDGHSLSAVRLDTPAAKTTLVSRNVPVRAVSADRNGLYWCETQADGRALLHWSSVGGQLPVITSTVDLGGPITAPAAASSTSKSSHVLFSDGTTDPDLLAARLFVRTFASPDPLPLTQTRRRATR